MLDTTHADTPALCGKSPWAGLVTLQKGCPGLKKIEIAEPKFQNDLTPPGQLSISFPQFTLGIH